MGVFWAPNFLVGRHRDLKPPACESGSSRSHHATGAAPIQKVISNDIHVFEKGLYLKQKYQTSFWDGLILAAAIRSSAKELWSEDFNHGQVYESVTIVNPFEATPSR